MSESNAPRKLSRGKIALIVLAAAAVIAALAFWLTADSRAYSRGVELQEAGAYSEADLIQQGFSEAQARDIAQMAKTAEDAATKVKTFTQLWDTLKESAQSGWTTTWEILVGDFEEAKEVLTEVSDAIGGVISAGPGHRR